MTKITQADRDLFIELTNPDDYTADTINLSLSYTEEVKAIAAYREQAERETVQKIVDWLMREEEDYPSSEYSGFAAMIREEIEAGEWGKP